MDVTQFYCKCGKCKPKEINPMLQKAIVEIEHHFGNEIVITSGHRCKAHNAKQGGASNSFHRYALAIDFWIPGAELQDIYHWIDENIQICGVGIYNTHVHFDVRSYKSRWDKRRF